MIGEIVARLHFDFDANAKYIPFYIPALDEVTCPEALVLNHLPEILKWPETNVGVAAGFGSERIDGRDLVFTGRIYLYSEQRVADELKQRMLAEAKAQGYNLIFRSVEYMTERNKWEKPRAFILPIAAIRRESQNLLLFSYRKVCAPFGTTSFRSKSATA